MKQPVRTNKSPTAIGIAMATAAVLVSAQPAAASESVVNYISRAVTEKMIDDFKRDRGDIKLAIMQAAHPACTRPRVREISKLYGNFADALRNGDVNAIRATAHEYARAAKGRSSMYTKCFRTMARITSKMDKALEVARSILAN